MNLDRLSTICFLLFKFSPLSIKDVVYLFFSLAVIGYILTSCNTDDSPPPKSEEYLAGELVAKRVCGSCHQYTPPELLDRLSWPNVMSAMKVIMKGEGKEPSYDDWIDVQRFYLNHAPKVFSSTRSKKPAQQDLFNKMNFKSEELFHSRSTMLSYDKISRQLAVGQQNGDYVLYESSGDYSLHSLSNIPIGFSKNYILGMGELGPSDDVNGTLYEIKNEEYHSLVSWMNRAIYFEHVDLNNNGSEEFVICSFGSPAGGLMTGELVLAYSDENEIVKTTLDSLPGATMTMIRDLDGDGKLDIVALFSQGNELVKAYYNQGDLKFKSTTLASFPPVYGTNSFDLKDMNSDGHLDLIITNGDNDDYSQTYKSYHGVRVLLNNGNNRFEESYFFNINGASKVLTHDFDKDGDNDFVVLAMYPDLFSRAWETLHYFENKGKRNFEVTYFESTPSDNWILMEIGDVDQDGDMDIMTAANQGIHGLLPQNIKAEWSENNVGLQIWENRTIN